MKNLIGYCKECGSEVYNTDELLQNIKVYLNVLNVHIHIQKMNYGMKYLIIWKVNRNKKGVIYGE